MTRAQILELGGTDRTVERWLARGHLIAVHRGVYAVGHLPTNPIDRAHGALLAAGKRSALAGAAALALYGVQRRWPQPLEVVVATDRRTPTLRVHRSKTLLRRDVVFRDGLRVTSPARTLLDVAPRLSDRRFVRALNELRMDHGLTLDAIADIVERNARHPGVRRLREELPNAQKEPTRSDLENAFMALVAKYKLPTPEVNVWVGGHRVDAFYRGHRLVVELDGWGSHGTRHAFNRDRRQDVEILARTGIPTVRLPYDDTTTHAERTAARLVAILQARA